MSSTKLIKNSVFYTVGNIFPQIAGFILIPIYTAYLDPEQYGIVNSMSVLGSVIGVLLTLGIEKGIYRLYYDYKDDERKVYLGTIIIGITAFSILAFAVIMLLPHLVASVYKSIPFYPYYFLMILMTLISKVITVPSVYLRVSEQAGKFVLLQFSVFILTAFFNLLFIIYYKQGAVGMLKGTLLANMIMGPVFYLCTFKAIIFKFNVTYFKNTVLYSLPLIPGFIFAWVLNLSDRIFLERYLTMTDVGVYSFGYKIASLITVFSGGVFAAYNPHFFKLANEGGIDAKQQIGRLNNIVILMILTICFFIAFFSREVIDLLISTKYAGAIRLIPLLTIAFFFSQITGFLDLMIYQDKKTLQSMFIGFAAAASNIISNILLIPPFGMMGSVMATLISFVFLFFLQYWYARKCYFVPFRWNLIITTALVLIGIYVIVDLLHIDSTLIRLLIKSVISLSIAILVYFKFRKQLIVLFSKK